MKQCLACSMPIEDRELCAGGDIDAEFCLYCVNENGEVKSCDEVFQGGVDFFIQSANVDREFAEKIVRKNMNSLPYWQENKSDVLNGKEATDKEFGEILEKIQAEI